MPRWILLLMLTFPTTALGDDTPQRIWDLQQLWQPPEVTWLDQEASIQSLTFVGPDYQGKPTEVFAFYATPGSVAGDPSLDQDLPAVVCLHGGGGTAFAEWVLLWAKRGYAAIAPDFSGRRPEAPEFDQQGQLIVPRRHAGIERMRLPRGGPEQGPAAKFASAGDEITDDWQYHAVSNAIAAHSLIRHFPEVDADRTAVTGISWGGYLTCISASVDPRFKAAVPVYGCGFLYEGESVQKRQIDRLSDDQRRKWIEMYDPSSHLAQCRVPILFVNGTGDIHYPLDSYMKSYRCVPGEKWLRIEVDMRHSHPAGWAPQEIERFIASKIRSGAPLPRVASPVTENGRIVADVSHEVPLAKAHLHYTTDDGLLSERTWTTKPATLGDGQIECPPPPSDATIWYLSATDQRGSMSSSEVVFSVAR